MFNFVRKDELKSNLKTVELIQSHKRECACSEIWTSTTFKRGSSKIYECTDLFTFKLDFCDFHTCNVVFKAGEKLWNQSVTTFPWLLGKYISDLQLKKPYSILKHIRLYCIDITGFKKYYILWTVQLK